jgi:hypothetical protein
MQQGPWSFGHFAGAAASYRLAKLGSPPGREEKADHGHEGLHVKVYPFQTGVL